MKNLVAVLLIVATACSKKPAPREAYAVGTYIGGGGACTYDATPAVAELSTTPEGKKFMAKLVGEGTITETCGSTNTTYDVVKPTGGVIEGPAKLKVGAAPSDSYRFVAVAGARHLQGVHQGGASPAWSLKDCDGVATFGPVLGAQDTGGADITRTLVAAKAGSCTVVATILGLTATQTVQIQ